MKGTRQQYFSKKKIKKALKDSKNTWFLYICYFDNDDAVRGLQFSKLDGIFVNLGCICSKTDTFSDILHKVKTYCLANSYHSPFESFRNSKKVQN